MMNDNVIYYTLKPHRLKNGQLNKKYKRNEENVKMHLQKIKNFFKNNQVLYKIYGALYGNRKYAIEREFARIELHKNGMKYINNIEKALSKLNLVYFLNFGSLLGLLRSGKFIKWDNDLDYGIFVNKDFSWKNLEKAMNSCDMKLIRQFKYNGKITEQAYKSKFLTIDFFGHYEDNNNSYEYLYFRKKSYKYESQFDLHVYIFKMYKFSGVTKTTINGVTCTIPLDADKYLASIYTENWKMPDPNWTLEKSPARNEIPDVIAKVEFFS